MSAAKRQIAKTRLCNILKNHGAALARTLEQKIADAGPYNQRVNPHIITPIRNQLVKDGVVHKQGDWFYLDGTPDAHVQKRIAEQASVHEAVNRHDFTMRVGQAGEIAVLRALRNQDTLEFFGNFPDLETHDDSSLYTKEEPPSSLSGRSLDGKQKLDFLVRDPIVGWAGIEVKNIRPWLYPHAEEIRELLRKSLRLDVVPILIARRIPYVTRLVLQTAGALVWETFNQRYPAADTDLADKARHKRSLGYHDIRTGNQPSAQLQQFITDIIPEELGKARERYDAYTDILNEYANEEATYERFAARIRRRLAGTNEENDWDEYWQNN